MVHHDKETCKVTSKKHSPLISASLSLEVNGNKKAYSQVCYTRFICGAAPKPGQIKMGLCGSSPIYHYTDVQLKELQSALNET